MEGMFRAARPKGAPRGAWRESAAGGHGRTSGVGMDAAGCLPVQGGTGHLARRAPVGSDIGLIWFSCPSKEGRALPPWMALLVFRARPRRDARSRHGWRSWFSCPSKEGRALPPWMALLVVGPATDGRAIWPGGCRLFFVPVQGRTGHLARRAPVVCCPGLPGFGKCLRRSEGARHERRRRVGLRLLRDLAATAATSR